MKKVSPGWWLALLLVVAFTLSTVVVPGAAQWNDQSRSDNVLKLLQGQGRRLFANECFTMADVYFHSGYYPSIFDKQEQGHDVAKPALGQKDDEDSTADDFLGKPPDWLAAWERHFIPNRHTHLDGGGPTGREKAVQVQQILPWLKLASDLNPHMIKTYTVGAYWMQTSMQDNKEARDFLFDGLRNNPGNSELLFDLGRLYYEGYRQHERARFVWLAALQRWDAQPTKVKKSKPALRLFEEITMNLAHLEEEQKHWPKAIYYLKMVLKVTPNPPAIEKQIHEAERGMAAEKKK